MPTRQDPEQDRWFVEQVLPLGTFLRSWLRGRFGTQVEIDDIVQESYSRLLRAHAEGTVVSPKAFLFHAARNLALNQIRHRFYTHPSPLTETDVSSVLDTGESVPETVARAEDIQLLIQAIRSLPARCRQVFTSIFNATATCRASHEPERCQRPAVRRCRRRHGGGVGDAA
jgi:RNA polymerase sigma-70 factor (ECF subfamily)